MTENIKPKLYALVGMSHRDSIKFVNVLPDDEPLTLIREPTNRYDTNAVQVWARDRHVGYVAKEQNMVLAKFIDSDGIPWGIAATADTSFTVKTIMAKLHRGPNDRPMVEV